MRAHTAKVYNWAMQKAESQKAPLWVGILFSLELILFLPLDAVLMFFCLQNQKRTLLYVLIATFASTLSGLIGYLLGHFLWNLIGDYVVPSLVTLSSFNQISHQFQVYENWAVFFGALLPFPLKAFSLAAGVFHLGIWPFFFCFILARLLRFSLIGCAVILWGEKVKNFVDRHFHHIFLAIAAKIALASLFFWVIVR